MEPLIDVRIRDWIAKLNERFAETGAQLDFAPWAVFVAYDIISEVGFGAPFGFIEQGTDVSGLIQGFHDGLVRFTSHSQRMNKRVDLTDRSHERLPLASWPASIPSPTG